MWYIWLRIIWNIDGDRAGRESNPLWISPGCAGLAEGRSCTKDIFIAMLSNEPSLAEWVGRELWRRTGGGSAAAASDELSLAERCLEGDGGGGEGSCGWGSMIMPEVQYSIRNLINDDNRV